MTVKPSTDAADAAASQRANVAAELRRRDEQLAAAREDARQHGEEQRLRHEAELAEAQEAVKEEARRRGRRKLATTLEPRSTSSYFRAEGYHQGGLSGKVGVNT